MCSNFIESYSFGNIVINGYSYSDDVILLDKKVKSGWWRKRGHRLQKPDIFDIIEYDPDLLIIGTGNSGRMSVSKNLISELDFRVEIYKTDKACKVYNKKLEQNIKLAGAFHLTC